MRTSPQSELVQELYRAASGQHPWDSIGRSIATSIGGLSLNLTLHDPSHGTVDQVANLGGSEAVRKLYVDHFAEHDLWAMGAVKKRLIGRSMTGSSVVPDRVLERSLIYNEFLLPAVNVHYLAGAILPLPHGRHAVLGVHRPRDARDFGAKDLHFLDSVLPHLQRALEVRHKVQVSEDTARSGFSMFELMTCGVVALGPTGLISFSNSIGERLLRRADGLVAAAGRLKALVRHQDSRLQYLIQSAFAVSSNGGGRTPGGHTRIDRSQGGFPYGVLVAPAPFMSPGAGQNSIAALVFVADPAEGGPFDMGALHDLFGFPRAEAELVSGLLSGMSLPDYSRRARISYNTARTLLARATARTGTRSQLELVLLLSQYARLPRR